MPLDEISAVQADPAEPRIGQATANVGNHRNLNRSVTEIAPITGHQKGDSRRQRVVVRRGLFNLAQ
jgi:hypothetical protein